MNNTKKEQLIASVIFVFLLFGILLVTMLKFVELFAINVDSELINYKILSYLVEVYESDEKYQHVESFLSPNEHETNVESIKGNLKANGVDVNQIDPEYIIEFKEIIKHSNFDIGSYSNGRLVNLKQSHGTIENAIYIAFMRVSNQLLQNSDKYRNFDEHIDIINKKVKYLTAFNVISILVVMSGYYLYKIKSNKKTLKLLSAMDKMVIVSIFVVLIFSIWRFIGISTELIYYSTFFEEVQSIDFNQMKELVVTFEVCSKFLLYFLRNYFYEFSTCFILMITLGEFAYARAVFKDEALVIANLFLEAIESDNLYK